MNHPFITAVQSALDAYGLPPGIAVVSVGTHWRHYPAKFNVWAAMPDDRMASNTGCSLDLATACQEALERQAQFEAAEAKVDAARAALAAAGYDPNLIPA
jgi:hypothetical protein